MATPSPSPSSPVSAIKTPARWWRAWWRSLSPMRQDRFATLAPLAAVLMFLAAIVASFWYLRSEEIAREKEALKRDVEYAQQRVRLRLLERQEQIMRIARDLSNEELERADFVSRAEALISQYPELQSITWIDERRRIRASQAAPTVTSSQLRVTGEVLKTGEAADLFKQARQLRQPVYSLPTAGAGDTAPLLQLQVPLSPHDQFGGVVLAEYSIDSLLRYGTPTEVLARYAVTLLDGRGQVLAGTPLAPRHNALLSWTTKANAYAIPVSPVGNGLVLRAQAYRTSLGVVGSGLFWLVGSLSVMTSWQLIATWRHTRRRMRAQEALIVETNFRRAMENSILTGMRALDLQGRITYVNSAFCQMTGWTEAELVGQTPPYSYWPEGEYDKLHANLRDELSGKTMPGGFQVRVRRKSGTLFDARLYVSPLVDARGQQTGWMTSMTDITEPNRVREQLTASHERFTTVLEGLDAAVSVMSAQTGELLFANRTYRLWFGGEARWHAQLAGRPASGGDEQDDAVDAMAGVPTAELDEAGAEAREVHVEAMQKWFDVRARYLQWTDGRLAQMLIATDVTARRQMEEETARQIERAQETSRLVTMGEMASSVAHELNQPLAAITNYCNGMLSRLRAGNLREEDLAMALEKTSKQAQRAGQIIHRIRQFVKRSEPQRQPARAAEIVEDALELATIELKRRNVAIQSYVAQRLPVLQVDPILIEQVLLNLLKNAAEAIDNAQMPPKRRTIELRVVPRHTAELGGVIEFSVTDAGPGIREEVIGRLYEAFFSTKSDGMGIGLSLCRSIIESHQGRMKAENLYNGDSICGCRFSFMLPVAAAGDSTSKTPEVH